MNICVYGASSNSIDKSYIEANEKLGKLLGEQGHTVVYGGGAGGMMGAVARGARSVDGNVIGISPKFFIVDGSLYDNCTEFIYTETMRERKKLLEEKSDAFIISPGGVGTLDEFFEIFTLKQLSRHDKPIAIYNVNNFYNELINMMEKAINEHFMTEKNRNLYFISNNPQEITDYITNYVPEETSLSDLKDVK